MTIAAGGQAPRLILAVGEPKRERDLREYLTGAGLVIVERCLDGPSVSERAMRYDADIALVASDLHRLSPAVLVAIRNTNLPLVLLSDESDHEKYRGLAHLLSNRATPEEVLAAVFEGVRLGVSYAEHPSSNGAHPDAESEPQTSTGRLLAVVGGKGAPGVTTVAIGLAHSMAMRGRPVVLVDADLRGGNVVPYLDLDPSHGLLSLAAARFGLSPQQVEEEIQDGPGFRVLAGLERPEDHATITTDVLAFTLETLRQPQADILVDLGHGPGTPWGAYESVLRQADGVLLVCRADLVGAWNARCCLRYLIDSLGVPDGAVALVINRQEKRGQYGARELAVAVGAGVLGAVPEDRRAAQRATSQQVPITATGGRVSHAIRELADGLTGKRPDVAAHRPVRRNWRPRVGATAERRGS